MIAARLVELMARPHLAIRTKWLLAEAAGLVFRVELGLLRADELRKRSRRELLSEAEMCELSHLVWRFREIAPSCRARLQRHLDELMADSTWTLADAWLLHKLENRLANVLNYLFSNDMQWGEVARRVAATLPVGPGTAIAVDSRVIPGAALGARFADGYPLYHPGELPFDAHFTHLPNLAQTSLVDLRGKTLFSGLRHEVAETQRLSSEFVARLSDDNLKGLIAALLAGEGGKDLAGRTRAARIDEYVQDARSPGAAANVCAARLQAEACRTLAMEMAAAALVADSDKFQRALAGETVDLDLFCIALLETDEIHTWNALAGAVARLEDRRSPARPPNPLRLQVCGLDGTRKTVSVNVSARQFVLSSEPPMDTGSWPLSAAHIDGVLMLKTRSEAVGRLLGPRHTRKLGGDVKAKVDAMNVHVARLFYDRIASVAMYSETARAQGPDHPIALDMSTRIIGLKKEQARIAKNARSLKEAGQQLKGMWLAEPVESASVNPHLKVGARLALVGHLMGATPVVSCMTGGKFTERLDAEVKFLATVAEHRDGRLPPVDMDMDIWGPARDAFLAQ